jgi:hypothetical protein
LVDHRLIGVDELVDDPHEGRDGGGSILVNLFKDLAIPNALIVPLDDLVVFDTSAGFPVLEEPVGVIMEPHIGLHDNSPEVGGISRVVVGHLEVGGEGLGQIGPGVDAASREVVEPQRRSVAHHQRKVHRHVIDVATGSLDSDVVGQQPYVGF